MMEIIEGLPENVVGIVVTRKVTTQDYNEVLIPALKRSLKRHAKVRLYYELGCRFPGASWEDLPVGIEHAVPWERVAVVTDVGWIRHTVNALRFVIPGEIRVFAGVQAGEGRAWITAPEQSTAEIAAA